MSKKKHKSKTLKAVALTSSSSLQLETVGLPPEPQTGKRKVIFALGTADWYYLESKSIHLAQRLGSQLPDCMVEVYTDAKEVKEEADKAGVPCRHMSFESSGPITPLDRLKTTNEMIRLAEDLIIPGFDIPLWKLLAMDDFVGTQILLGAKVPLFLEADINIVIIPMTCVDNNTVGAAGLYTWLVHTARKQGIPIIALEISPLGNKHTMSQLPADHYMVKSQWAKNFLLEEGMARAEQVSILRPEEAYLARAGQAEYPEAYARNEEQVKALLGIPPEHMVVFLSHHVAFMWEAREVLRVLAGLPWPLTVVIRAEEKTTRRNFTEPEIVAQNYKHELAQLSYKLNLNIGHGLLLQFCDVIIANHAGAVTEHAQACDKMTIIHQMGTARKIQGDHIVWEPVADNIPGFLQKWKDDGLIMRSSLAAVVKKVLPKTVEGDTAWREDTETW